MPRILADLRREIQELKALMLGKNDITRLSEWMDVEELRDYLPGHPAKCTVYQWIRYDGFPHYQNAKSYWFRRSEVDDWLIKNGRKR